LKFNKNHLMEIVHVSAECYPVAKAGGLGDVVGALPRYQNKAGHVSKVVMPMYRTRFLYDNAWEVVHKGAAGLGYNWFDYTIIKEATNRLGFDLYLVDINGLLDRQKVYGYDDDTERFMAFQIAFVDWLSSWQHKPDIVHVHDHHTGMVPFMMQHCHAYRHLEGIPTVLTIHNAQYQGLMDWDKSNYIPAWDSWKRGLMEWEGSINPLACAVKCAWKVTTVSQTYMHELKQSSNGLEALFEYERGKCTGILNGIDNEVWDPSTDPYLELHYKAADATKGKADNKRELCGIFGLDPHKPLIIFVGRLVGEKAADLLPQVISDSFHFIGRRMNFLILGSGEPDVEARLETMKALSAGDYGVYIGYNEGLAHRMYAGADFLLMPSRVEPCGLNQMYAMRYGTVPVVRKTGGLQDTVKDIGEAGGYGITHLNASVGDVTHGIYRAVELYRDAEKMKQVRKQLMKLDFSWNRSAKQYLELYRTLK
jgi:starch synthase